MMRFLGLFTWFCAEPPSPPSDRRVPDVPKKRPSPLQLEEKVADDHVIDILDYPTTIGASKTDKRGKVWELLCRFVDDDTPEENGKSLNDHVEERRTALQGRRNPSPTVREVLKETNGLRKKLKID
jgi:hypothetical protein